MHTKISNVAVSALGWLGLLVLATSPSVWGQTNAGPVRPISLQDCFEMALKNNLSVQIERLNPILAEQGLYIARGYYDPTVSGSYTHSRNESGASFRNGIAIQPSATDSDTFSTSLGGAGLYGLNYGISGDATATDGTRSGSSFSSSSGSAGFNVSQPLLKNFLIDNGRYNIELSKNSIKQTEQQLLLEMMTVLNDVEQRYYDLIFARESVKVQEMALELAQRLQEENRKRVQIGVLAPLDEKQSESQVAARQTDLTSARRNYSTAQNNLKKLITAQYRSLHDERLEPNVGLIALPYNVDLYESWGRAMNERPDLLQARLEFQRQGITLKYTKNQLLPELDIKGSYGYNGSGNEFSGTFNDIGTTDRPFWTAGAAVSVPVFNRVARGNYRQSKLNVQKALLGMKSKEEAALVQVDEDINQLKSAWAQVGSTRAARIYAEEALSAEQKKLEAGKSTSFFVLSLQNDLTAARSNEIAALANYNKIQAQLAFDEGHTLKRHSINVQIK